MTFALNGCRLPDHRLSLVAKVTVSVWGLHDLDLPTPNTLDLVSWSFRVRGADQVGVLSGVGSFSQMVTNKGRLYAVEDLGAFGDLGARRSAIRVLDASDPCV